MTELSVETQKVHYNYGPLLPIVRHLFIMLAMRCKHQIYKDQMWNTGGLVEEKY